MSRRRRYRRRGNPKLRTSHKKYRQVIGDRW